MSRKLRVEYRGAIYHVMSRGDRREPIFKGDSDRQNFLETLGEACVKTGWRVHAYCLMPNHFHLVIETPQPNLVAGMKWFLGTYTSRFNRRHKLFGHLFSGRYKSLLIDGSGDGYLKTVCDYVHLNASRAKLLGTDQSLRSFRWSSWGEYLKAPSRRPAWLRVDRLLGECRIPKDSAAGRQQLEKQLEARRGEEDGAEYRSIRRGWCFGEEAFRRELLEQVGEQIGREHYGEERHESQIEQAERLVVEELKKRKLKESDLPALKKGDSRKIGIAQRLREETMVTVKWISERLHVGSVAYLNNRLYLKRKGLLGKIHH